MLPFLQKGIFLNNRTSLPGFGVNPVNILADLLDEGGFRVLYYHIAQGAKEYFVQTNWWQTLLYGYKMQPNADLNIIRAVQAKGIQVVGFGMLDGVDPVGEGLQAAAMVRKYGLNGWALNVEEKFDLRVDAASRIGMVCSAFRTDQPKTPLAYLSWPYYDHAHPVAVAKKAMEYCDVAIPMAYVMDLNLKEQPNTAMTLASRSMREWKAITTKPIVLAGRAFQENGYTTTPDTILAFDQYVRAIGSAGISWWFLDHAQPTGKTAHPSWWSALKSTPPFGDTTAPKICPCCGQVILN